MSLVSGCGICLQKNAKYLFLPLDKHAAMCYNIILTEDENTFRCENFGRGGTLMAIDKKGTKQIADNRKARHDYFVLETIECGIELVGTEVKSIRKGGVNLKDSWCSVDDGEMWVKGMHISPYDHGNIFNRDPLRVRRLLLHKREIMRLFGKVQQEGLTLIPMSLYFKGSRVKLALGLCKGKKLHDKRDDMAKKAANREIERTLKERNNM